MHQKYHSDGQFKKKLVQVSSSIEARLGGPSSVVQGINPFLVEKFRATLIIFGTCDFIQLDSILIPTLNKNRYGFSLRVCNNLARSELENSDILLIHGFYLFSTLIAIFFSRTTNIFLMPHGSLELYQERKSRFRKYIFRKIIKILLRGRRIHFLLGSESEKDSIYSIYPDAKITVVGLGVDEPAFLAHSKKELSEPIKLFCMSRISEKKRIDLCIRVLSKLNDQKNRYTLHVIGSGDEKLEAKLRKLVFELKLENHVKFSGFLEGEQKAKAIADSDIFLLPSENENFAVAVAESICAGKPVVVSNFVAMHEFVDRHQTGITLDSLDVEELASAIESVVHDYPKFHKRCIDSIQFLKWKSVQKNWMQALDV